MNNNMLKDALAQVSGSGGVQVMVPLPDFEMQLNGTLHIQSGVGVSEYTGTPAYDNGLVVDGSNVLTVDNMDLGSAFTFTCQINYETVLVVQTVFKIGDVTVYIDTASMVVVDIGGQQYTSQLPIAANGDRVTITYADGILNIYVNDSVETYTSIDSAFSAAGTLYIGNLSSLSSPLNCGISDFRVWYKALADLTISRLVGFELSTETNPDYPLIYNGSAEGGDLSGWEINDLRPYISVVTSYNGNVLPSSGAYFFHWSRNTSNLDDVYIQQVVSDSRIKVRYGKSLSELLSSGKTNIQVKYKFLCHSSAGYGMQVRVDQYDAEGNNLGALTSNFTSVVGDGVPQLVTFDAAIEPLAESFQVRLTGIAYSGYLWFGLDDVSAEII